MKTIKVLAVIGILFLTSFGSEVQAQEKQNDATWEETIEFLRKYSDNMRSSMNHDIETYLDTKVLKFKSRFGDDGISTVTIPLDKLKEAYELVVEKEAIILDLTGNYVTYTYSINNNVDKEVGVGFYVDDSELHVRILKAFKHLTYLAIEKRKKEREANGDKF